MTSSRTAALGLALTSLLGNGCAGLMNGVQDTIKVRSDTPGARVYVDGFDATTTPPSVPNDRAHIILVRAPNHSDAVVIVHPRVRPIPIILDILFAVPSFALVPLTDLGLNSWYGVDSPDHPIEPGPAAIPPRSRPSYRVGPSIVRSSPDGATPSSPTPVLPPAPYPVPKS